MCACARSAVYTYTFFRQRASQMPRIASPLPCWCPLRFITFLFIDSTDATFCRVLENQPVSPSPVPALQSASSLCPSTPVAYITSFNIASTACIIHSERPLTSAADLWNFVSSNGYLTLRIDDFEITSVLSRHYYSVSHDKWKRIEWRLHVILTLFSDYVMYVHRVVSFYYDFSLVGLWKFIADNSERLDFTSDVDNGRNKSTNLPSGEKNDVFREKLE